MKLKKCVGIFLFSTLCLNVGAIDHKGITFDQLAPDRFTLMENGVANEILVDEQEDAGVMIAVRNLQNDFKRVSGRAAGLCYTPGVKRMIMVGTLKSRYIRELVKAKKIDASLLEGKNEKYLMTVVSAPLNGVDEALVIAGSDKRGTIYGIYELSEQIGVSAVVCFPKSRLERWLRFLRSRPLPSVWNNVLSLRNLSYLYWLARVKCHIICVKPEIHACFQGFRLTMMLFSVFLSLKPLLLCIVVVIPSWYLLISLYK